MDFDTVFVNKHRDLAGRVMDRASEWDVFMAAPLLRDLLFGTPEPQVHTANRGRGLRLRFTIDASLPPHRDPNYPIDVLPVFWMQADGFDPETMPSRAGSREVSIDGLLAAVVIVADGAEITVRDVIDYVANAAGAVHFGDRDKNQREIVRQVDLAHVDGAAGATRSLVGIGRVVVRGLQPLVDRIVCDRRAPDAP